MGNFWLIFDRFVLEFFFDNKTLFVFPHRIKSLWRVFGRKQWLPKCFWVPQHRYRYARELWLGRSVVVEKARRKGGSPLRFNNQSTTYYWTIMEEQLHQLQVQVNQRDEMIAMMKVKTKEYVTKLKADSEEAVFRVISCNSSIVDSWYNMIVSNRLSRSVNNRPRRRCANKLL